MGEVIASGQITIVDLNDAKYINGYISSSQPRVQIYNPSSNTYTPDWSVSPVVLTPEIYVTGTNENIITQAKSILWYEKGNQTAISTGNGYAVEELNPRSLTISSNKLSTLDSIGYICEIVWVDPDFNKDVFIKAEIDFAKVSSGEKGEDVVTAYTWAPNGNVVKNKTGSAEIRCDLYKGSTIVTSNVTYQWEKLVSGSYEIVPSGTTKTLTVAAADISSLAVYRCHATYGGSTYTDTITIVDQSDPIQVVLVSAEGTVFKNGQGTKNVTAQIYRAGILIDESGTDYTYRWYLKDKTGSTVTGFGGSTDYKTGKTISVLSSDIEETGSLILELHN